jgi:signal transduction histidine kinase/CheY-like chemotaxis protein/PAS domain-containing protein
MIRGGDSTEVGTSGSRPVAQTENWIAGASPVFALQVPAAVQIGIGVAIGAFLAAFLFRRVSSRLREREVAVAREKYEREAREAQQQLLDAKASQKTAEDQFRAFLENSPMRSWICDADGVVHHASPTSEVLAKDGGNWRGRKMNEIFSSEIAERMVEADRQVLKSGSRLDGPLALRLGARDFEIHKFPIHTADGATRVASMAVDVTEHHWAQAGLRQQSELLTTVTEALRVYLENGDWKRANELLLLSTLRRTQSESGFIGVVLEGLHLRVLAHQNVPWASLLGSERLQKAQEAGTPDGTLELAHLDELFGCSIVAGSVVFTGGTVTPGPGRSGAVQSPFHEFLLIPVLHARQTVGLIAVAHRPGGYHSSVQDQLEILVQQAGVLCDSYRRRLREESLEEQVRVSQKVEAIGLLAGGVAHDFNNLLQVIQGYTAMALDSAAPWPERRANLDEVRGASERAAQLTQQLLAFSRQQKLQRADLNLNVAITELLRMLRRVLGEQNTVDFIPGHDLGNVHVDRAQIDQVLLNLCLNARDALTSGGRITIETENVLVTEVFLESHPWAKPGRYVLLTVTDNGIGMSKETLARVFEPFFTTKPKGKGTGLGLSVVYGVVKQHDGMIHVYSEPGKGTTFKIYLPITARVANVDGSRSRPTPARGSETILLAEDEAMVRDLAVRILTRAGYRVIAAVDGAEAVALHATHRDEIALLLLDVVMPNLGGAEAYTTIAATHPGIPVIFCSGYAGSALQSEILRSSGAQLIAKPYGADELLRSVRLVLDAALATRTAPAE